MSRDHFAVIGNPIEHSLSPSIYSRFAKQFSSIDLSYKKILGDDRLFESQVKNFFHQGAKGMNVTAPFKRRAFEMMNVLTNRAMASSSVNSIFALPDGRLEGDNTDGVGLVRDITHHVSLSQKNMLILGAGAAVQGVLPAVFAEHPASVTLVNRDMNKARQIAARFSVLVSRYEDIVGVYDVVINATPLSLQKTLPPIKSSLLHITSFCYDMVYDRSCDTVFVAWAKAQGAKAVDGFGMLLEQAAENFYRWYGLRPLD